MFSQKRAGSVWAERSSFDLLADIYCTTKRAPAIAGGKRGAAVDYLDRVLCTPIDPADAEIAARVGLSTPYEVYQTFTKELDIVEGDTLVNDTRLFHVRAVFDYDNWMGGDDFRQIVLEQLKAT